MAVNREVIELADDLAHSVGMKQADELFKAALALAYQVGVRDGIREAASDVTKRLGA